MTNQTSPEINIKDTTQTLDGQQKIKNSVEKLMKATLRIISDENLQVELIRRFHEIRELLDGKRSTDN